MLKYLKRPFKFDCLNPLLKKGFKLLDVGCGNHSPSSTKWYYPEIEYYGVDKFRDYNLDDRDFACIHTFFQDDLDGSDLKQIPENYFDCIIFAHVIEHLKNGEDVLLRLINKLKRGGIIYLEFPHARSLFFPRMKRPIFGGTLNFYDDPTHVRIYEKQLLEILLKQNNCEIVRSGRRISMKRILLFPVYFLGSIIEFKHINGGLFWDILGFADYIVARRL